MFLPQEIIRKKRDGLALGAEDIAAFVRQRKAGYNTPKRVFFADMTNSICPRRCCPHDPGLAAWRVIAVPSVSSAIAEGAARKAAVLIAASDKAVLMLSFVAVSEVDFNKACTALAAAAAAFALLSSGLPLTGAAAMKDGGVKCAGINSCKGHSECKTATHECKGHNSCKGDGWVTKKSAEACVAEGGKVVS